MKILIYGVGGIGGFIGAFLCKTKYEVFFLSRGQNFLNLKKNGLNLKSSKESLEFKKINVSNKLEDFNNLDIVILCVKLYDFKSCLLNLTKVINKNTIILPFQNGIIAEQLIREIYGSRNNFGAVAQISSHLDEYSKVIHKGNLATFFVGPLLCKENDDKNERLINFCNELASVGLDMRYTEKINQKLWDKFIFLSAYSGMTTLTEMSIGEIFENNTLKKMFIKAMKETLNLSKMYRISFQYNPVKKWEEKIHNMPYDMTSSMYIDFKNNKRLELDWLSGSVVKLSQKFKLISSTHQYIVENIHSVK